MQISIMKISHFVIVLSWEQKLSYSFCD